MEKLPTTFITDYIAHNWELAGQINADIKAISEEFTDIDEVKEILQELSDAILMCNGLLEAHLQNTNSTIRPNSTSKLTDQATLDELIPKPVILNNPHPEPAAASEPAVNIPSSATATIILPKMEKKEPPADFEPFEYFTDF